METIFEGNESLSIIEIFEEALEKSLENLNISDTGKQLTLPRSKTLQNNRLNALLFVDNIAYVEAFKPFCYGIHHVLFLTATFYFAIAS